MPHERVNNAPIQVILAGGAGNRLRPLSRPHKPKPFLHVGRPYSMFQETLLRANSLGPLIIICGADHYKHVETQCRAVNIKPHTILLEPAPRNTAPAMAVAAHYIAHAFGPDKVMLALPADHAIADSAAFTDLIARAYDEAAREDALITFGIRPTRPAPHYGYIKPGDLHDDPFFTIAAFTEKPDKKTARTFMADGYFWNSGMVMGQTSAFLTRIEAEQPALYRHSHTALASATRLKSAVQLNETAFAACPALSFDVAILERRDDTRCMIADIAWRDLGTWRDFIPHMLRRTKV